MSIHNNVGSFHQCDLTCPENRYAVYRNQLYELSARIYGLKETICQNDRYPLSQRISSDQAARELRVAIEEVDQVTHEMEQEVEALGLRYQNTEADTLARLDTYKRDIEWIQKRINLARKDAGKTAERAEEFLNKFGPAEEPPSEDSDPAPVFEREPESDNEAPATPTVRRRGWESPLPSDDEEEEEDYKPPTRCEQISEEANRIWKETCKWVKKNRVFAFSIGLNVLLLTMRKFSRTTCPAPT